MGSVVIGLLAAVVEQAKDDYISIAKEEYARKGLWNRKDFDRKRLSGHMAMAYSSAVKFINKDPYHAMDNFSPDEIFDAWDKQMLHDLHTGDQVKILSDNTRLPKDTICKIEKICHDEYYIRNVDSQYCCWAKAADLILYYDETHCKDLSSRRSNSGSNRNPSRLRGD